MPHPIGDRVARFYDHLCDPMGKKGGTPPESLIPSRSSTASGGERNPIELAELPTAKSVRRNASEFHEQLTADRLRAKLKLPKLPLRPGASSTVRSSESLSYPPQAHTSPRQVKTPDAMTTSEHRSMEAAARVASLAERAERNKVSVREHAALVLASKYKAKKFFPSMLATPAAHASIFFRTGFNAGRLLKRPGNANANKVTPEEIRKQFLKEREERAARQAAAGLPRAD